jgi:hypothetical protein
VDVRCAVNQPGLASFLSVKSVWLAGLENFSIPPMSSVPIPPRCNNVPLTRAHHCRIQNLPYEHPMRDAPLCSWQPQGQVELTSRRLLLICILNCATTVVPAFTKGTASPVIWCRATRRRRGEDSAIASSGLGVGEDLKALPGHG